jgi:hypothetical protein
MEATKETTKDALRITNQFRSKGGMAYDLRCEGVRLALYMVQRASTDDPGEWRVEARGTRPGGEPAVITMWGATRADALRAVGAAWANAMETEGLRVFDWEAMAKILGTVRALG